MTNQCVVQHDWRLTIFCLERSIKSPQKFKHLWIFCISFLTSLRWTLILTNRVTKLRRMFTEWSYVSRLYMHSLGWLSWGVLFITRPRNGSTIVFSSFSFSCINPCTHSAVVAMISRVCCDASPMTYELVQGCWRRLSDGVIVVWVALWKVSLTSLILAWAFEGLQRSCSSTNL